MPRKHLNSTCSILLIILVTGSSTVFAEGGCPTGQYPQQGQGWKTCVPIPGYEPQQAVQPPPPSYASRWGAVASSTNSMFGIVSDQASKEDAERTAVAECIGRGGEDCKLNYTYANQCVAVIGIPNQVSQAFNGGTPDEASKQGLDSCRTNGIDGCWVYYSGCSIPERLQ